MLFAQGMARSCGIRRQSCASTWSTGSSANGDWSTPSTVACAPPPLMGLARLAQEGTENEIVAVARYRGQRFRVRGLVAAAATRSSQRVVVSGDFNGEISGRTQSVHHPFLKLTEDSRGLICFFLPEELKTVAAVQRGTSVHVSGVFQQYDHSGGSPTPVLVQCRLEAHSPP